MAEKDQDSVATQEVKYPMKIVGRREKGKSVAASEDAFESLRILKEIIREAVVPRMDVFPRFGGWINGKIFEIVEEVKRGYEEQIEHLKKIKSQQGKSFTVCDDNEENGEENVKPDQKEDVGISVSVCDPNEENGENGQPSQEEAAGKSFSVCVANEKNGGENGKLGQREAAGKSLSVCDVYEANGEENGKSDQKEAVGKSLSVCDDNAGNGEENGKPSEKEASIENLGSESVTGKKEEEETKESDGKKKKGFLEKHAAIDFKKFEVALEETKIRFPDVEWDTEKSENEDSDGKLEKLTEQKDRAVNLGIELTRALIEFSLLRVHKTQIVKQVQLKNWILWRSCKENPEVFYLIDFLLCTAKETAGDMIKTDEITKGVEEHCSEDGISADEKIKDDLLVRFAKAICALQSIVSCLQLKSGIPQQKDLALLNHMFNICEENLQAARHATSDLKERLGWETDGPLWKKMELQIKRYWNSTLWNYVSREWLLRLEIRFPLGLYALHRWFLPDIGNTRRTSSHEVKDPSGIDSREKQAEIVRESGKSGEEVNEDPSGVDWKEKQIEIVLESGKSGEEVNKDPSGVDSKEKQIEIARESGKSGEVNEDPSGVDLKEKQIVIAQESGKSGEVNEDPSGVDSKEKQIEIMRESGKREEQEEEVSKDPSGVDSKEKHIEIMRGSGKREEEEEEVNKDPGSVNSKEKQSEIVQESGKREEQANGTLRSEAKQKKDDHMMSACSVREGEGGSSSSVSGSVSRKKKRRTSRTCGVIPNVKCGNRFDVLSTYKEEK